MSLPAVNWTGLSKRPALALPAVSLVEPSKDRKSSLTPQAKPDSAASSKQSKVFVRLKLGLIGFVLNRVRCSLFVVFWHKPLFLLYLCLYCPF